VNDLPRELLKEKALDVEFLAGLAVHNGLVVASIRPADELIFVDAHARSRAAS